MFGLGAVTLEIQNKCVILFGSSGLEKKHLQNEEIFSPFVINFGNSISLSGPPRPSLPEGAVLVSPIETASLGSAGASRLQLTWPACHLGTTGRSKPLWSAGAERGALSCFISRWCQRGSVSC